MNTQSLGRHNASEKHQRNEQLNLRAPRPTPFACMASTSRQNTFWMETCDVLVRGNIPLDKLRDPVIKPFLEKWTRHKLPDPSTLRMSYIPALYDAKIRKIREEIGDNCIALSVDETIDKKKRCIANAVITPLLPGQAGIPRLIHCDQMQACNAETMISFIMESLNLLWPEGIHHDRLLIYNTDAARYMTLSGELLCSIHGFYKMIQVTCTAHGWHRVVEEIRRIYANENDTIAEVKKVFSKAPTRIDKFHELAPGIPLPPEPIVTRWGTWINAAIYYANNFQAIHRVLAALEPDADCVEAARDLFELPHLEENFNAIMHNYACIETTITQLEGRALALHESIKLVEDTFNMLFASEDVPINVKEKMTVVFGNNVGYCTLKHVDQFLETGERTEGLPDWSQSDLEACKYAPITSCEVERTFSRYKKILAEDRQSFLMENLTKHVIVNCFKE